MGDRKGRCQPQSLYIYMYIFYIRSQQSKQVGGIEKGMSVNEWRSSEV